MDKAVKIGELWTVPRNRGAGWRDFPPSRSDFRKNSAGISSAADAGSSR